MEEHVFLLIIASVPQGGLGQDVELVRKDNRFIAKLSPL